MEAGHNLNHPPFQLQGPYNPQHTHVPHPPHRLYLRADPEPTHKRTVTTKNSFENRQHQSSAVLRDFKRELSSQISQFTQNIRQKDRIRTHSKNRTEISEQECVKGEEQFGRITMHCLRRRREVFEKDAHELESEYAYVLRKIQKMQKDIDNTHSKVKRKNIIQTKHRRELFSLSQMKASNDSLLLRRKEELKEQIISHRAIKAQNVIQSREAKMRSGEEQRSQEEQIHEEIFFMQESRIQQNRLKCEQEKKGKLLRQKRMKNEMEERRTMARKNFKNKWLEEYEREEQAKQEYQAKKVEFERKIRQAIDVYKEIASL